MQGHPVSRQAAVSWHDVKLTAAGLFYGICITVCSTYITDSEMYGAVAGYL